jgi:hypothetical protein
MEDPTPAEKFRRWILRPLEALRDLPDGDGGFAAFSICCGLFERFIRSRLKANGQKATTEAFIATAAKDLGCDEEAMRRFRDGFRLGLQHAFQPKAYVQNEGRGDKWGWEIASGDGFYKHPEIVKKAEGVFAVRIDPWKFVDHVTMRWKENLQLLNELNEFAFGKVGLLEKTAKHQTTDGTEFLATATTYSSTQIMSGLCDIKGNKG